MLLLLLSLLLLPLLLPLLSLLWLLCYCCCYLSSVMSLCFVTLSNHFRLSLLSHLCISAPVCLPCLCLCVLCSVRPGSSHTDAHTDKGVELCCLSWSLMWPVSFFLSGHSHHFVRAKVMFDSFSQISSPTDGVCLAQSKRMNLLVVTAFTVTWKRTMAEGWEGTEVCNHI